MKDKSFQDKCRDKAVVTTGSSTVSGRSPALGHIPLPASSWAHQQGVGIRSGAARAPMSTHMGRQPHAYVDLTCDTTVSVQIHKSKELS